MGGTVSEPYAESFRARWADMDFNQHMRNAAFLGYGEETRMRYLDSNGWTMDRFQKARLGPVVLEDKLTYKHELHLLERFRVDLAVAAITEDGRRMKLRNRFFRESDNALCAVVESVVLWFDLDARKPVPPPEELRGLWLNLGRTEDFESWPAKPKA
jgi:acyl-CoA thioester hydrolase